jgi:probable HAF family extracellular repeat protein
MGCTRNRKRWIVASSLALVLPLLLQAPTGAATGASARSRSLQAIDLGTLPGASSSWATGINDRGWVVGEADMGNMTSHGFLWRHGRMTDLSALDGPSGSSNANDINNRGEVVGLSSSSADDGAHAFL